MTDFVDTAYDQNDWYWIIGNSATQVYGNAANSLVSVNDQTYKNWLTRGSPPSHVATVQDLFNILRTTDTTSAEMLAFGTATASAATLPELKYIKQTALDTEFDDNFDIPAFIRGGTATVTAANVGNFIAQITNNYRTLRAQIAAAATPTALNAIDITSGWPANP